MTGHISLSARLAPYTRPPGDVLRPGAFRTPLRRGGLRERLERRLDEAVERFELDRMLYEIEVDATARWLDRLAAFDAFCAERERRAG